MWSSCIIRTLNRVSKCKKMVQLVCTFSMYTVHIKRQISKDNIFMIISNFKNQSKTAETMKHQTSGNSKYLFLLGCKRRPNQKTGLGNRGGLKFLNGTKLVLNKHEWPLNNLGLIWYHSERSDITYIFPKPVFFIWMQNIEPKYSLNFLKAGEMSTMIMKIKTIQVCCLRSECQYFHLNIANNCLKIGK